MEQTNLVVTADGKTWDEVTRDVSYIGTTCVMTSTDTVSTDAAQVQIFDEWRGVTNNKNWCNKDFAIAYDRRICLVEGEYQIRTQTVRSGISSAHCVIFINGTVALNGHAGTSNHDTPNTTLNVHLKRGDYVEIRGAWYQGLPYSNHQITRI